jgi:rod shape-determining protein MreC
MEWLSRHKRLFLSFGMVICLAAIIITANPNFRPTAAEKAMSYIVIPLKNGVSTVTGWIGGVFSSFGDTRRLQLENNELREQIGRLAQENRRLRFADDENKELSALLEIAQKYAELPTTGASIIGKAPNDWFNSFSINKGYNDGLQRNMAILGDFGLLGRIAEVYPNHSTVITIIDHRFAVAVKNIRTEDLGVVKGDMKLMQQGLVRMEYIDGGSAQIMAGDEIVTSAHSSMFPPGILVGEVIDLEPNPDGLTMNAIVRPAVTINRIENVLVVTQVYGDENATTDELWFAIEY